MDKELTMAIDAAQAGARAILAVGSEVEDRGRRADRAAHEAIVNRLRSHFPQDGVLSEESLDKKTHLGKKRIWVVDPLDGTREYEMGLDEYAVSVGLVERGRPVLGIVVHPPTGQVFRAIAGQGSYAGNKRLGVPLAPTLARTRVAASRRSFDEGRLATIASAVGSVVPMGSIAWRMVLVAAGRYDVTFSVHPLSEWDVCAADLIVTEAGGKVVLPGGARPVYGREDPAIVSGLLALPAEADDLARALRELGVS